MVKETRLYPLLARLRYKRGSMATTRGKMLKFIARKNTSIRLSCVTLDVVVEILPHF